MTGVAKPKIEQIHLMHCSLQYSDGDAKTTADIRFALNQDPHMISFTELGAPGALKIATNLCRAAGYALYKADAGNGLGGDDCAVAVKQGENIKFKEGGTIRVHPGQVKPESQGGRYGPKNVSWAHAKFFEVDVFHHVAHWVHNQTDDTTGVNLKRANAVSEMIGKQVVKHGKAGNICFFAGDMNVDPDQKIFPKEIFTRYKLVTTWEDSGQKPTHGARAIDVMGRYGADTRVTFKRYKVYPVQNSDHRPVSAWYDVMIKPKKGGPQDPDPNPDTPDPDDPDDDTNDIPKYNAGNRDWSDYTDDQIYQLPQAVDDTDLFNG